MNSLQIGKVIEVLCFQVQNYVIGFKYISYHLLKTNYFVKLQCHEKTSSSVKN